MKDQKAVYFEDKAEKFYLVMTNCINEELTEGWNVKEITSPIEWINKGGLSCRSCLVVFERDLNYGE